MSNLLKSEMEVYVLAPFGRDAALISDVLQKSGVRVRLAASSDEVAAAIPVAGAALIAEEALSENIPELASKLNSQPPWSDFPIIVLTGGGTSTAATEVAVRDRAPLGNVTLLERPLRAATLISAVRSAITARRRQYEIRDHLHERKLAEDALRSARDQLEAIVEDRTSTLRRLSIELLRVQDDERRRIARELHDSLGQYLAAAKIQVGTMALGARNGKNGKAERESLDEVQNTLDRAIAETRTLSHLLHPPLLDAAGLASAATWYVEGFGKRSGIQTSLTLPEDLGRLSMPVETALFRIMQEALTNVHRHSGSKRVDITVTRTESLVALVIRDFGKGINDETLEQFNLSGTKVGVGLAGIRERLKELGGTFQIESSPEGTTLTASIPISQESRSFVVAASSSEIYSSFAI